MYMGILTYDPAEKRQSGGQDQHKAAIEHQLWQRSLPPFRPNIPHKGHAVEAHHRGGAQVEDETHLQSSAKGS